METFFTIIFDFFEPESGCSKSWYSNKKFNFHVKFIFLTTFWEYSGQFLYPKSFIFIYYCFTKSKPLCQGYLRIGDPHADTDTIKTFISLFLFSLFCFVSLCFFYFEDGIGRASLPRAPSTLCHQGIVGAKLVFLLFQNKKNIFTKKKEHFFCWWNF